MRHLRNTLTDGTELYLDYQGLHVRVQEPMSQSRALTVNLQRPANAAHFMTTGTLRQTTEEQTYFFRRPEDTERHFKRQRLSPRDQHTLSDVLDHWRR